MKVLIVAFWFPPANFIGAIRVGKLARYLDRHGHDIRVLTTDIAKDRSLPLEIPRERVVYTDYCERKGWLDLLVQPLRRRRAAVSGASGDVADAPDRVPGKSPWDKLRRHYYGLIHVPDLRIDWLKTAVPAGRRLIDEWKPDIIFASAPPFTGLILASRLSRVFNIPWVADFRDLWVDDAYYSEPRWRRPVDAMLERLTLSNAAGLVTVSPIWAQTLRRRHGKTAEVVYNGYAMEDFPKLPPRADQGEVLTIRYTGSIYRGYRDPSPLFVAIAMLEGGLHRHICVEFFGESGVDVEALAAKHGIADRIVVRPRLPYRTALQLQLRADVLLLLQCNDRRDEGNLPAKLFEYLYARRPILFIGYEQGIAARLVSERGAGLISNTPERIRDQLQAWIEDKRAGRLGRLDPSVSLGLSRDEQFRKLEDIFAKILHQRLI